MKIFWSWQSDIPGKIARHFVRDVLVEAIEILKQNPDGIEEPIERETREALHLDHDRKGVPGSPDLARTIFRKIDEAAVFIGDVTIVGEQTPLDGRDKEQPLKKFINSNVAIEYGYALRALGDERILSVQNRYFGDRHELPFDLKHKAGPIQYSLAPNASPAEINAEKARLRGELVTALRPYLLLEAAQSPPRPVFPEKSSTTNPAVYFEPDDVLARVGEKGIDEIEYRFSEQRAFYLRLIPTVAKDEPLKHAQLYDLVHEMRLDVLLRQMYSSHSDRNRFGAIAYTPHGSSTTPIAFTQTFTSGELWGLTTELFVHYKNDVVIPTTNVENIYTRVLGNYCRMANEYLGIPPPYQIELGATGLKGVRLGVSRDTITGPIYENTLQLRQTLDDLSPAAQKHVIDDFMAALFGLVGEDRPS